MLNNLGENEMNKKNIILYAIFIVLFIFVDTILTYIGTNEPFNYSELNPILLLANTDFSFMLVWKIILTIFILAIILNFSDKNQTILIFVAVVLALIIVGLNTFGIIIKLPEIL